MGVGPNQSITKGPNQVDTIRPGWWGPGWWSAPYPYSAPSPVVTQSAPMTYIQQAPAPDAYWYYCNAAGAYYPYVKDCPGGWMQVVPAPNPPGP